MKVKVDRLDCWRSGSETRVLTVEEKEVLVKMNIYLCLYVYVYSV